MYQCLHLGEQDIMLFRILLRLGFRPDNERQVPAFIESVICDDGQRIRKLQGKQAAAVDKSLRSDFHKPLRNCDLAETAAAGEDPGSDYLQPVSEGNTLQHITGPECMGAQSFKRIRKNGTVQRSAAFKGRITDIKQAIREIDGREVSAAAERTG